MTGFLVCVVVVCAVVLFIGLMFGKDGGPE